MISERSIIELLEQQDVVSKEIFCAEGGEIEVIDVVNGI